MLTSPCPDYADALDVDSVTDLDPEFTIATPTDGTLELDNSQAPVLVNVDDATQTYTFRYWTVGTFTDGDVDIDFIGNSFDYLDISGEAIGNFADQSAAVQDDDGVLYVVVEFGASLTLDAGSVDVDDVTASWPADGTVSVTLSNITERGPPGSYRFDVTAADLAAGDEITIHFTAGGWTYNGQTVEVETTRTLSVGNLTYIDIRLTPPATSSWTPTLLTATSSPWPAPAWEPPAWPPRPIISPPDWVTAMSSATTSTGVLPLVP